MKDKRLLFILSLAFALALAFLIRTRPTNAQGVRNYTCKTTSVTSATVPVTVIPAGSMTAWLTHVRSGAAASVLIFPYLGTLPGSAPAGCASGGAAGLGCMEVTTSGYANDIVSCTAPACLDAVGEAWGAVLSTGSTAVTFDACSR